MITGLTYTETRPDVAETKQAFDPLATAEAAQPRTRARVLIADDDDVARHRLAALIESDPSFDLVAVATDADEAIALAAIHMPDIVILDWVMPGGGGSRAATDIASRLEDSRIVGISAYDDLEASYDMLKAGAIGFVKKTSTKREILDTLYSALEN